MMQEVFDGPNGEKQFEAALVDVLTIKYGWQTKVPGLPVLFNGATEAELKKNLAKILFLNNNSVDRLNGVPLSDGEMEQVIDQINLLPSSVAVNDWVNGKTIYITRDNPADKDHFGKKVTLFIFDRDEIAAGRSFYQIVRQPKLPTPNPLASDRRGDIMLLINGLPLFHVELKKSKVAVTQASNQIMKYAAEGVYSQGLFSLVQIFVAMTPEETIYFANPGKTGEFKPEYFFHWADYNNEPINKWYDVAKSLLSIPRAHEMIGYFTVADKGDGVLKVMRSYQVIAAESIVKMAKAKDWHDVEYRGGYIWHTTGSGKTMTSFQSAQLIANNGNADKVIFLIDRIELGTQSFKEYCGFADEATTVNETDDTWALVGLLKSDDRDKVLIVTSIQKMSRLREDGSIGAKDLEAMRAKRIVVIVDECHRSVFGDMMRNVHEAFPKALFFGFTGTPIFGENARHGNTELDVFGERRHTYAIADGIRDKNVLGFDRYQVQTYKDKDLREQVAFAKLHVTDVKQIVGDPDKEKVYNHYMNVAEMTAIEDEVPNSQYSREENHKAVIADILDHLDHVSAFRKFHGILATASIPEAIAYYRQFKQMAPDLKVAALFDPSIDNDDPTASVNKEKALLEMLADYNARYHTTFSMPKFDRYKKDVALRLAHKESYKNISKEEQIDLLIVVNQMLTGFDSKWVNVLYLDKMLERENIIQAFSRTNRLFGPDKPYGIIRYYRRPHTMAKRIDEAIKMYCGDRPYEVFVNKLPANLKKFNAVSGEIKDLFVAADIPDYSALPTELPVRAKFAELFNSLVAIHEAMKPQGFSWAAGWTHTEDLSGKPHVLVRDLDKGTYQIWLKRYQELPSTDGSGGGGSGSGGGFDIPFDINPYLTEMHPEAINAAYMNTHFQKFLKVLGSGSADEKKLLDELHKSFAALSQDEQKFAKMFLADVQNGDAKLEPGLAFYDYVQKYIKQAKDDLIHAHAEGMGIDEQKLRDLADAHPNAVNLNLNKRFDLLMETVDKTKAKAYIEKIRGGVTIKPKDVMIEADEILRDFLIV